MNIMCETGTQHDIPATCEALLCDGRPSHAVTIDGSAIPHYMCERHAAQMSEISEFDRFDITVEKLDASKDQQQ